MAHPPIHTDPGEGQKEFIFPPDEQPPLSERFAHLPMPAGALERSVAREVAGGYVHRLLAALMSGKDATSPEQMEKAWQIRAELPTMSATELAQALRQLNLTHNPHITSARDITIVKTRTALERTERDAPQIVVQKLQGPFMYEDMKDVMNYAIAQGLTTKRSINADWRSFRPTSPIDEQGRHESMPERIFASFLYDAHLPDWRRKAQKRLDRPNA